MSTIRSLWTMKNRPQLSQAQIQRLEAIFDQDLAELGNWLGIELCCANYEEHVSTQPLDWVNAPVTHPAVTQG